jgi:hypothetical protein
MDAESPVFATATDQVLPRLVDLLKANFVNVLVAGFLWLGVNLVGVLCILLTPFIVAAPGFFVLFQVYGSAEPPDWAMALVIIPSMLAYLAMFVVVLLGLAPAMQGSLHRAYDAALMGEPVPWSAPVTSLRTHLRSVMLTNALLTTLTMVGLLLLILPGILFGMMTMFAIPAAALDGLGPVEAVQRAFEHARANPGYHVGVVLGAFLIAMICGFLPLVGNGLAPVVSMAWVCSCYREAFPRA